MLRNPAIGCGLVLSLLLVQPPGVGASATELEPKYSLDQELDFLREEKQVTLSAATKTSVPLSKSTSPVTVITREQIDRSGAATIPDLLRMVPGVQVRWNPMMETISMRGFGQSPFTNRVLLLIDGVPYNVQAFTGGFPVQPGFDYFPLENVKQIEVVKGPGSSLYGENAYWGVINIVSISGQDLKGGKAQVVVGDRNTRVASIQYGKGDQEKDGLFSFKQTKTQFPMHFWESTHSETGGQDLFLKGRKDWLTLSYSLHQDATDGFNDQSTSNGVVQTFSSVQSIRQRVQIFSAKVDTYKPGVPVSFGADLSHAKLKRSHCTACHAAEQDRDSGKVENHGQQNIIDLRTGLHMIPHNDLLFGVEWRQNDSEDHGWEIRAPGEVQAYDKGAFYAQDQISLFEDRLNLLAGARYDAKTAPDLFGEKISPRLGASFEATRSLTFRTGWSRAYRYPSFTEMYQNSWFFNQKRIKPTVQAAVGRGSFTPNPDLQPEEISTYDLGFEYRLTKDLKFKTDVFRSNVKRFMVLDATRQWENHPDDARITGMENEVQARFSRKWNGFANLTWQTQKQEGDLVDGSKRKMEFVYAPKFMGNVGATYASGTGIDGTMELQWKDNYMVPASWRTTRRSSGGVEADADSTVLVNLRMDYTLAMPEPEKFGGPVKFSVIGRNLLNEHPEETVATGRSNPQSGREMFFGITYNF